MENNIDIEAFKKNVNGMMAFAENMIAMKRKTLSKKQQKELDKKLNDMDFKGKLKEVKNSTEILDELKKQM